MPDTPHPPFAAPAMTQPRQLQKWLDVNPQGGPLNRTQTYITIPAFNFNITWLGFSEIVGEFHYAATHNFSLKSFSKPSNPNHTCCISYVNSDNTVIRYRLWSAVSGEVIYSSIPDYAGQMIKKNFRVEIWSADANPLLSVAVNIYSSVRGNLDYRYGIDSILITDQGLCQGQQSSESDYNVPINGIFGYDMSTAFRPGTSLINWPSRFNALTMTVPFGFSAPSQDTGGNFPYICHVTDSLSKTGIAPLGSLRHIIIASNLYTTNSGPIWRIITDGILGTILLQQEPTNDRISVLDDFNGLDISYDHLLGVNFIVEIIIDDDDTMTVSVCDMDGFILKTVSFGGVDHTALGNLTEIILGDSSSTICIGAYAYPQILSSEERNQIFTLLQHNAFPVIQDSMALPLTWGACAQPVLNS